MIRKTVKIGVIAGTPVDTQMGVDFVNKEGYEAVGIPTASCPEEQSLLQFLKPNVLTQKVIQIINTFKAKDIYKVMIYCNSLSAAIDLENIRKSCPSSLIITPHDIYKKLAINYKSLMIWAANGQSLAGIERVLYENNPEIQIVGISMLPLVISIENKEDPQTIFDKFCLENFTLFKTEGLVLGCTHFPYLKNLLDERLSINVIDPAEQMLSLLVN